MRVILRENIENLGKKGDIVNVARGYGRNYLIPNKIATEVTSRNIKMIEIEQKALQKGLEKEMASYQELIDRLNAITLSFTRKTSEKDVIFGSVSSTDIRDALAAQGFDVEKKKILLDEPIKRLGNFTVPIKIFHEERAEVKLAVVKEGESGVKEEKDMAPDLMEEEVTGSEPVDEKTALPLVEEKKEEIAVPTEEETQDVPPDEKEEPRSEPEVAEDIPEETEKILEEPEEITEGEGEPETIVGTNVIKNEKKATEEPSLEETREVPLEKEEEEPEEIPQESGEIPKEAVSQKPGESPENGTEISDETKEIPEDTNTVSSGPEGKAGKDHSQKAASKNNK